MHPNRYKILFSFVLVAVIAVSCKTRVPGDIEKLPRVKDEILLEALDEVSTYNFRTFYSKITTEYKDSSRKVSFRTSIRMMKDSILNATISYASIPIINSVISPDSVYISNKREKCYIEESIEYFKQSFGVSFTHMNLEELLLGKPLGTTRQ